MLHSSDDSKVYCLKGLGDSKPFFISMFLQVIITVALIGDSFSSSVINNTQPIQ